MTKILIGIAATLALLLGAAPAEAAPQKDVTFSYSYIQLETDPVTGDPVYYDIVAQVQYVDGQATTRCTYFRRVPGTFTRIPAGQYTAAGTPGGTSSTTLKQFCIDNFPYRTV
jgi:ABC-type oligopeptide transport system substrate-binding subunit